MNKGKNLGSFPDPSAPASVKTSEAYGKKYAKAILAQWGAGSNTSGLYDKRMRTFEVNRDYAQGTQSTQIYKQILNSLNPNASDGTLLNIDWSPVPIVPKFVKIVVNKVLAKAPYPNVEAIDPLSRTEKEMQKARVKAVIENKEFLKGMREIGVEVTSEVDTLPDTAEEAEIFLDTNIKVAAEIATQLAVNLTLEWNSFNDSTFRRAVEDLVVVGMAAVKRENDPNYGITERYVDPANLIHSYTEDPMMNDLVYAGEIKEMSILDLKRVAKNMTNDEWLAIAKANSSRDGNDAGRINYSTYDEVSGTNSFGYDEFRVTVLDFEFIGLDQNVYEEKNSKYGNVGFYKKGEEYHVPTQSVYDRNPVYMDNMCLYGGMYIDGANKIINYGKSFNQPRNIHDITRTTLSYSITSTNFRKMMPKSMVGSVISFADQMQITHLKLQQSIAKAKPDGIMIDIEGLENVQLGTGGELSPLDIQDIYEQTGVIYYRSKNPDGGFQNPPIRSIDNSIRNINELIGLYNHYLNMIRDATGINEVMDGSTPKGEQLVGVREQAMAAANNAIYDITHSSLVLYRKVCEDIIKCIQILPKDSVLHKTYIKAIGQSSMDTIKEFEKLPMKNFGIMVQTEMNENDRLYLEQNIQQSLAQGEIDLEDAIAIRRLQDVDQAERLLVIRRAKRIKRKQAEAMQNIQAQSQAQSQSSQVKSQLDAQMEQVKAQAKIQVEQAISEMTMQRMQMEYSLKAQIEAIKGENATMAAGASAQLKEGLQELQEDRKDDRIDQQAAKQSMLISQRQGMRGELEDDSSDALDDLMNA